MYNANRKTKKKKERKRKNKNAAKKKNETLSNSINKCQWIFKVPFNAGIRIAVLPCTPILMD